MEAYEAKHYRALFKNINDTYIFVNYNIQIFDMLFEVKSCIKPVLCTANNNIVNIYPYIICISVYCVKVTMFTIAVEGMKKSK